MTYNTLIDVYGKTGQWAEALGVLHRMEVRLVKPKPLRPRLFSNCADGQTAVNPRAFKPTNTLQALKPFPPPNVCQSITHAQAEGIKPVTRTYNTLMIACNASGQWQEALGVYESASWPRCSLPMLRPLLV